MKRLHIQNFKCLKNIEISDLKRVNLFTGKNNTGKSTILEALLLLDKYPDIRISQLLNLRDELAQNSTEIVNLDINKHLLTTLFSDYQSDNNEIIVSTDSNNFKLKLVKYIEDGFKRKIVDNDSSFQIASDGLSLHSLEGNVKNDTIIPLEGKINFSVLKPSHGFTNFKYIDSTGNEISLNNASLWDMVALSDKKTTVIRSLQIIDPSIIDLIFVADSNLKNLRYPIVKLNNDDNTPPLKSMGEGINRILTIILTLVKSSDGYLLIDEFENGLHYSIQEKLWEIIFDLSEKLNVQVFITTHSNDTITSFAKVLEKKDIYEGSLYRLDRKKDDIKAYLFSKEEIVRAAHHDINLR